MLPVPNAKCGFYRVCELVISICLSCYTGPYKFFGCTTALSLNKINTNNLGKNQNTEDSVSLTPWPEQAMFLKLLAYCNLAPLP